jgi:hypothetical protein
VNPVFSDLFNGAEVLAVTSRLRCSMYDNALVPIVLANRLISLADVRSSEILARFAAKQVQFQYRQRSPGTCCRCRRRSTLAMRARSSEVLRARVPVTRRP